MPSTGIPPDGSLVWWDEKHTRFLRLREFVWVVASPPRRRGPHRQAATQECTQIGGNGPSAQFWGIRVHYCDASSCKVRFLVTLRSQTALFRDTPAAECDGKAHSGCAPSRKGALCDPRATQTALFREGDDPRMRFCVRRRHVCAGEEKRILRKSAVCVREPGMVVPHPVFCRPADTPDTVHRIR